MQALSPSNKLFALQHAVDGEKDGQAYEQHAAIDDDEPCEILRGESCGTLREPMSAHGWAARQRLRVGRKPVCSVVTSLDARPQNSVHWLQHTLLQPARRLPELPQTLSRPSLYQRRLASPSPPV